VCDEASARKATADIITNPVGASILITIDKATQNMTVLVDGVEKYDWPVSTGKRGYSTPSGTYTATSMNEIWVQQGMGQRSHAACYFLYERWSCHPWHP
jgi:hypothetical protein